MLKELLAGGSTIGVQYNAVQRWGGEVTGHSLLRRARVVEPLTARTFKDHSYKPAGNADKAMRFILLLQPILPPPTPPHYALYLPFLLLSVFTQSAQSRARHGDPQNDLGFSDRQTQLCRYLSVQDRIVHTTTTVTRYMDRHAVVAYVCGFHHLLCSDILCFA